MSALADLTFEQAHHFLREVAGVAEEWAGLPMPLSTAEMVIHPKYPYASIFNRRTEPDAGNPDPEIINAWWSKRLRVYVTIFKENGQLLWAKIPASGGIKQSIETMGCVNAWIVDAELRALEKLREMVNDYKFRCWLLTGMFVETSPRSGVTYLFRRLRPTVAFRPQASGESKPIAALCLHPIGYYQDTWAGAMCPTDECIGHLTLMRGDEHDFWKQSNQISPERPEAGL